MEKLKVQHDHTLTDILKVGIFGLMLILPLLIYAPTAFYYGFNEHAIEQTTVVEGGYEVRNKYETNEVNTYADLVEGNIYHIDTLVVTDNYQFEIKIIHCDELIYTTVDVDEIYLYDLDNSEILFNGYLNLNINIGSESYITTVLEPDIFFHNLEFVITSNLTGFKQMCQTEGNNNITSSDYQVLEYVYTEEHEVTKDITQMMDQNWKELWQTDLFKWTNTSILKNGLDNFTGAFGVTDTSCITNLITYELIIVGIYVVIDIVIAMFKWLTHLIGTK